MVRISNFLGQSTRDMARYSPSGDQRQRVRAGFFDEDRSRVGIGHAVIQRFPADVRSDLESRVGAGVQRCRWGFGRDGGGELHRAEGMEWEEGELHGQGNAG